MASEHRVAITENLPYNRAVGGLDLLGLIAGNYLHLYHPVGCASRTDASCNVDASFPGETAKTTPFTSPAIRAAMLPPLHWTRCEGVGPRRPLGILLNTGVLAQRVRGPAGTHSSGTIVSGFPKDANDDLRLKHLSPPFVLDRAASQLGCREVGREQGSDPLLTPLMATGGEGARR